MCFVLPSSLKAWPVAFLACKPYRVPWMAAQPHRNPSPFASGYLEVWAKYPGPAGTSQNEGIVVKCGTGELVGNVSSSAESTHENIGNLDSGATYAFKEAPEFFLP